MFGILGNRRNTVAAKLVSTTQDTGAYLETTECINAFGPNGKTRHDGEWLRIRMHHETYVPVRPAERQGVVAYAAWAKSSFDTQA